MAIEDIKGMAERIPEILSRQPNEAQTNQWLVEPFVEALGYRISDPTQVEREATADFGGRQSYKVDYIIKSEGVPIVVIECKRASESLGNHFDQLKGYFSATAAEIAKTGVKKGLLGVLTNGLVYQFFTDQNEPNILDVTPFWEIDVRSLNSKALEQLGKLERGNFNAADAVKGASELNHINSIRDRLALQLEYPDDSFVDLFGRELHSGGNYMPQIRESFRGLVKSAFREFVGEQIRMSAERGVESLNARPVPPLEEGTTGSEETGIGAETARDTDGGQQQQPTDEELEGYEIVKPLVGEVVAPEKVTIRDAQQYCAVFLDDNNRRPLCRLHFNRALKYIGLFDGNRGSNGAQIETRYPIESLQDIHNYADQLRETARRYLES